MISYKLDYDNYIVKIPFNKGFESLDEFDNILDIFKDNLKKLIVKYNICGDVLVNLYLDINYGIIMEINNYNNCSNKEIIDTKIIFKFDCIFLVSVNYFDYIGTRKKLYYYDNKFYKEIDNSELVDSEVIYDSDDIIDNSIILYA